MRTGLGTSMTSADAETSSSLATGRSRSRAMMRDSPYARRVKQLVVENIVSTGVGLQAQIETAAGAQHRRLNAAVEAGFISWSRPGRCHTGGTLPFADMERVLLGEVVEAGEIFVRLHMRRFGDSDVPLALEIIEPERLPGDLMGVLPSVAVGEVRLGVEVDGFGRPLAYWFRSRHPGDVRGQAVQAAHFERVPADEVIHIRIIERWPQTRSMPWLHAVLLKLDDINEYTGIEIAAARASASLFGTISQSEEPPPASGVVDGPGAAAQGVRQPEEEWTIEPLSVKRLSANEKLDLHNPARPNDSLDPFLRYMLREVAAGSSVSYESLSRDYSQGNYSSSRLALLDDRDVYRALQRWWARSFREPLHRIWLQQAALVGAIPGLSREAYALDPERYAAARFKFRGWQWVDPAKEVKAALDAIGGTLTSITDVVAATAGGADIEDVIATIKRERELLAEAGIAVAPLAPYQPSAGAPTAPADAGDVQADQTQSAAA